VDRWLVYLEQRWAEGCHNRSQLWRELQVQGADFAQVTCAVGSASAWECEGVLRTVRSLRLGNDPVLGKSAPSCSTSSTTHLHSNKPSRRACAPFLPTSPPLWNWPNSSGACCGNAMPPHGRPGRRRPANLLSTTSRSSCNAMRPQCGPRSPCLGARGQWKVISTD